jgi:hypothetical protein
MDNEERVAELERQCDALANLAGSADLQLGVPTCPGWSIGEGPGPAASEESGSERSANWTVVEAAHQISCCGCGIACRTGWTTSKSPGTGAWWRIGGG